MGAMGRATFFSLLLCAATLWPQAEAPKQHLSAADGDLREGKYSNPCLGFTYPIPTDWTIPVGENIPGKDGKAQTTPGGGLILLMLDHRSSLQSGERIVISALELLGSQLTAEQYVSKIVAVDRTKADENPIPGTVELNGRTFSKTFYRVEQNGTVGYKAMVATEFRGYFLGWTVLGTNLAAVNRAIDTLNGVSFAEDQPDPRCALTQAPTIMGGHLSPDDLRSLPNVLRNQPPPEGIKRVRVSQGVSTAMVVSKVPPQYPAVAREAGIQGAVHLHAIIDTAGNIKSLDLIDGEPSLANSAMEAVKQWKYKPYLLNGRPVEVDTQITVNFELSN